MKREIDEKRQKNIVQKAKKIRSMVMMSLLCILMLSAATYAWFSLSNTAKVSNLTMTVGDVTGLQIAPDENGHAGTFGSSIDFSTITGKLLPATSQDGKNFFKPYYNEDGEVSKTETKVTTEKLPVNNATDSTEGYYIEYSFWLKSLGKSSNVTLVKGEGLENANGIYDANKTYTGTYILSTTVDNTKAVPGSAAVRISFIKSDDIANGTAKIFEPNSDISISGLTEKIDYAKDTTNVAAKVADVQHGKAGNIVKNDTVISLNAGEPTKITMYIWIEGKDLQCVNQIAAKAIKGQIVFTNEGTTQNN